MSDRPWRRAGLRPRPRGGAGARRASVSHGRRALAAADGRPRVAAAALATRGGSAPAVYPSAPCEEAA